jgi:hypothetical protein
VAIFSEGTPALAPLPSTLIPLWKECLLLLEDAGSLSITLAAAALPKDQSCTEKPHS